MKSWWEPVLTWAQKAGFKSGASLCQVHISSRRQAERKSISSQSSTNFPSASFHFPICTERLLPDVALSPPPSSLPAPEHWTGAVWPAGLHAGEAGAHQRGDGPARRQLVRQVLRQAGSETRGAQDEMWVRLPAPFCNTRLHPTEGAMTSNRAKTRVKVKQPPPAAHNYLLKKWKLESSQAGRSFCCSNKC